MPSNSPQTPAPGTDQEKKSYGPGEKPVSIPGIIALAVYLIVLTVLLLHGTVQMFNVRPVLQEQNPPGQTSDSLSAKVAKSKPADSTAAAKPAPNPPPEKKEGAAPDQPAPKESLRAEPVNGEASQSSESGANSGKKGKEKENEESLWTTRFWFIGVVSVSKEFQLILIVIFAGALGSLVHALRSLSWYVGNRQLMASWIAMYGLLPFMGASLAVVFYLVIRGGFFSAQTGSEQVNLFGFAAVAGLVGMFSEQALLKLKDVAETLFTQGEQGNDPVELKDQKPQNPPSAGDASGTKTGDAEKKGNAAPSPADAQPDTALQNPKS